MNAAILLVAYGATGAQNNRSLNLFEQKVRRAFPETCVRWAFTSPHVRRRLAEAGKKTDSVREALARLRLEKFERITVQSLHVIPGGEYRHMLEELAPDAEDAGPEFSGTGISVGLPLLHDEEDVAELAKAMLQSLPEERGKEEIALWVGHGARQAGKNFYELLKKSVQNLDENILLGTLEEGWENILPEIQKRGAARVWLLPLLSIAGKHTLEDMAGEQAGSWRSRLELHKCRCVPVTRGLIEYPAFADIWLRHLREARRLDS
jgi:sirohydrochlorin cobaltochelatase